MKPSSPMRYAQQLSLNELLPTMTVLITVAWNHPLLQLKRKLDWPAIKCLIVKHMRKAGKNVDGKPGQPLDIELYVPLIVLMLLKHFHSRDMETYLSENAVARAFIGWEDKQDMQVRDHSTIARIMEALGEEGIIALNTLIVQEAVVLGFGDIKRVSGDTTAQELPIGYPHEAGILKGLAERCGRALGVLMKQGKKGMQGLLEGCKTLLKQAKEYHLFAKGKAEKDALLHKMVKTTRSLIEGLKTKMKGMNDRGKRRIARARAQLSKMVLVGETLLPQILHWLQTGKVAAGKLIHAGITNARAIVRNKAGKAVEFGYQYLLCRIAGGYLFGELVEKPTGESKMPGKCLALYRKLFGATQTPDMLIYDRGGYSAENVKKLSKAGIAKVGIQPKGQAPWAVDEQDRKVVLSERGQMEGAIGILKSTAYGFNKPRERSTCTLRAAGQRSIISKNLRKLMSDLMKQENNIMKVQEANG